MRGDFPCAPLGRLGIGLYLALEKHGIANPWNPIGSPRTPPWDIFMAMSCVFHGMVRQSVPRKLMVMPRKPMSLQVVACDGTA